MTTLNHTEINWQWADSAEGTIAFSHNGILFRSTRTATFDNSPNNNFSTYSAPLVAPNSEVVGRIEWDIIDPDTEDEADACDWEKFTVYID